MRNVIGLAADPSRRLYFYSDIQQGSIYWLHFNGSQPRLVVNGQSTLLVAIKYSSVVKTIVNSQSTLRVAIAQWLKQSSTVSQHCL